MAITYKAIPRDIPGFVKEIKSTLHLHHRGQHLFNALVNNDEFKGMDFYASSSPGGGMAVAAWRWPSSGRR